MVRLSKSKTAMNLVAAQVKIFGTPRSSLQAPSELVFSYRREVDGLRAIAVIPVVLFHAKFEFFAADLLVSMYFLLSVVT